MNEKVSTAELVDLLAEHAHISQKSASNFIRVAFPLIGEILQERKYLKINGLGTFKLITVSSRESVNVNTGKRILIESYNKITFTPDTVLKEKVNKPFQHFETVELRDGVDFSSIDAEAESLPDEEERLDSEEDDEITPVEEEREETGDELTEEAAELTDEVQGLAEQAACLAEEVKGLSVKAQDFSEKVEDFSGKGEAEPKESVAEESSPASSEPSAVPVSSATKPADPMSMPRQELDENEEKRKRHLDELGALALKKREEYEKEDPTKRFSLVISVKHCFILSLLIIAFLVYICVWKPAWLFDCSWAVPEADIEEPVQSVAPQAMPVVVQKKKDKPVQSSSQAESAQKEAPSVWITTKHADYKQYKAVGVLDSIVIQPGNSLTKLSKKYYGSVDLWPLIADYNRKVLQNPDNLPIGETIFIPRLAKK